MKFYLVFKSNDVGWGVHVVLRGVFDSKEKMMQAFPEVEQQAKELYRDLYYEECDGNVPITFTVAHYAE